VEAGDEMMSEIKACPLIKACPFCGFDTICEENHLIICLNCGTSNHISEWNTRPIEDALQARIAELEKQSEHWHRLYQIKSDLLDKSEYETIDVLNNRITELESKQRWIPVSEKKPLNGVDVFGYFNNGDYYKFDIVCYYAAEDVWTADDHVLRRGAVTYWFEMPELPDEVQS
jgi:BMFP domain-containing protein YqiC